MNVTPTSSAYPPFNGTPSASDRNQNALQKAIEQANLDSVRREAYGMPPQIVVVNLGGRNESAPGVDLNGEASVIDVPPYRKPKRPNSNGSVIPPFNDDDDGDDSDIAAKNKRKNNANASDGDSDSNDGFIKALKSKPPPKKSGAASLPLNEWRRDPIGRRNTIP